MRSGVCPVCLSQAPTSSNGDLFTIQCPRCGKFRLTGTAEAMLGHRGEERMFRARLSHAIQRRHVEELWPEVSSANLEEWGSEKLPPIGQKLDNLLLWMASQLQDDYTGEIGLRDLSNIAAVVGVVDEEAADSVLDEANRLGLIRRGRGAASFGISAQGWERLEHREVNPSEESTKKMPDHPAKKKVFIGHGGRSLVWLQLKDFLMSKLQLECEEFNSQPAAGLSVKERLEEMLDAAGFAFLVMTGEDERGDGKKVARMNVVHEVGLFQGRLGFKRAIVLLEQGCEEFSNIIGVNQIRFPVGDMKSAWQEVRDVLEREGMLKHQGTPSAKVAWARD